MPKYTKEQIAEKVQQIACDLTATIPETVNAESRFVEDLRADSLDMVEIVMRIEDELEIEIPDEDVEGIKTIGQAIEYVAGKVGA